jgi:hypothetical protein
MKHILLTLMFIVITSMLYAQENESEEKATINYYPSGRNTYVGLNMTPLIGQLVPFNRQSQIASGPYFVHFRRFVENSAFRFSLGWQLVPDINGSNEPFDQFFNMRFGLERRKHIFGRWAYNWGLDVLFIGGSPNLGNSSRVEVLFGGGITWGLEYQINNHLSVNIETAMIISIAAPGLRFIPPVGINLNYVLPRKPSAISKLLFE